MKIKEQLRESTKTMLIFFFFFSWDEGGLTAVQLVFNPFSQLVPQLELYSQLQLSLWSDPIAFSVPKLT